MVEITVEFEKVPDNKMHLTQEAASGELGKRKFKYLTTLPGGMPLLRYRGHDWRLPIESLIRAMIEAADKETGGSA